MKDTVVVDTSIAVKWIVNEPDSTEALALLAQWFSSGTVILAPPLLLYEVTNVLHQRIRKGSITFDEAEQALANVLVGALELDFSQPGALSVRALQLAHRYALPAAYDPHYLALAERENCEYWTADARLWNAVKGRLAWVRWLGDFRPADQRESS
jgi:predicted nucleic acid-binding protein